MNRHQGITSRRRLLSVLVSSAVLALAACASTAAPTPSVTATAIPPTATPMPATATPVPPSPTPVPPTASPTPDPVQLVTNIAARDGTTQSDPANKGFRFCSPAPYIVGNDCPMSDRLRTRLAVLAGTTGVDVDYLCRCQTSFSLTAVQMLDSSETAARVLATYPWHRTMVFTFTRSSGGGGWLLDDVRCAGAAYDASSLYNDSPLGLAVQCVGS